MYATTEGTTRYIDRFAKYREAAFYRTVLGLEVSSLGIGTLLGAEDDAADLDYTEALIAAGQGGINLFDTAIHYRDQRSERAVGAALRQLQRDEIVVCTKAGFLTPGAVPAFLKPEHVAGGMHSMAPDFLVHQIDTSRANLGVDTIDVFYLHDPETQLGFLSRGQFDDALRRSFARLELLVAGHKIRWYGVATWNGFRHGALSLPRMAELALAECGPEHHFRFLQLPFHLGMVEAYLNSDGAVSESVLQAASRLGIAVVACTTLSQTQVLDHIPQAVQDLLPGMTNAQRAIQFTRSTPGIAAALVGMGRSEHVRENLGVAPAPPATPEQYRRLYQ
jgi:aryl-alcohol dehydrogenase-like predicted oxidoreductase